MSDTKFTKGPWKVLEVGSLIFVGGTPTEDHPYFGATRYVDILGHEDYPRKRADANLVAAAPDMYEALNTARTDLLLRGKTPGDALLDLVDAALRKARGEQP